MPLLTLHTTGDGQVPIEQARILQRRVDAAGRHRRLVQRVICGPGALRVHGHGVAGEPRSAGQLGRARRATHGTRCPAFGA